MRKVHKSAKIHSGKWKFEGRWMVSKKRIVMLLVIGVVAATMMVLALNVSSQALGYGATGATSTGGKTGAEVGLFGVAGAGLIAAGYFLTRKARS